MRTTASVDPLDRPALRGVLHRWAFVASLLCGVVLVAIARPGTTLALSLYAVSVTALFGTSALYHGVTWKSRDAYRRMRRLDHAMIFVLMVGSFTPFALLALHTPLSRFCYALFCAASLVGVVIKLIAVRAPKWISAALYLGVGWLGVLTLPDLFESVGVGATLLIVLEGLVYSTGAIIYARRRPDPFPRVFGYHELFHSLVIIAAALHFTTVVVWLA